MNPYLLPSIEFGPQIVRRVFARIPASLWDTPVEADRFSPREVIAHLADWEPIMLERMKTALSAPGAEIEVYDEGQMAETNGYRQLDPNEQIESFIRSRTQTAAWLRALPPDAWANVVLHPERGRLTIDNQANLLLGHDLYHIEQLMGSWEDTGDTSA